ncbi:sigma-70 family RNA polymerase sigma factor [Roseibacillus ishigakijimensis]|uniref:Sigma-70 family RNA polymerase sigma factor n=1 Tax=Roseibacillus ishigakijimensis TaxID=454146 RepID=A0A934RTZ6_9BACT|nr:sigma-70 family RNA polymerase sigma factor [Roseibacillus ishigakijimensis]MBK1834999.1 sigma-70 family RNA polymerase sigma factor [Roseibacillus ishigakijimensis]
MKGGLSHWDDIISTHPVLDWQEEGALARQRDEGGRRGEEALEKLVLHNLRAVVQHVERMNAKECDKHDLFMSGLMGLRKAAERWKPMHKPGYKKPAPFVTYAYLWIREGVNREARKLWKDEDSLDAPLGNEADSADGHETRKEAACGEEEQEHLAFDASLLKLLTAREREIVTTVYLEPDGETPEEMAARLGLAEKSVLPMLYRATRKLIAAA